MSAQPLTHHAILDLVEPFTQLGRQLDLPASDRLARRLVFRPVEIEPAPGCAGASLRETLRLENPAPGRFELTRVLGHPCGLEATLVLIGAHPAELLARSAEVEPARQFSVDEGIVIAQSYRLEGARAAPGLLTRAVVRVCGLTVTLEAPLATGAPAEIELKRAPGDPLVLPEDLLAVLGWNWGLLRASAEGWRSAVHLRGREPRRSRLAERTVLQLTRHLDETLRGTPAEFHARRLLARWGVALRRALPVLVSAALIAGVAALPKLHIAEDSAIRMLLFNLPPVLLVLVFCLREIPPFEMPSRPRPLDRRSWREP